MFFEKEENVVILEGFLRLAKRSELQGEAYECLENCIDLVGWIVSAPNLWDERCRYSIKEIGSRFIGSVSAFDSAVADGFKDLCFLSYRFVCEFIFFSALLERVVHVEALKIKIEKDVALSEAQKVAALYEAPVAMLKSMNADGGLNHFRGFEQKKIEAERLKERLQGEIDARWSAANELKLKLDEYHEAFNFVGLSEGFSRLAKAKRQEAWWLRFWLLIMGLSMLAPFVFELWFFYTNPVSAREAILSNLFVVIPVISIEVILIYFFRIILSSHRSVRGQLVQLDLRRSICEFIQGYGEYSAKIKKADSGALDKFENMIFSGLQSDPDKIPSTFDGLDQIVALIKSVKSA